MDLTSVNVASIVPKGTPLRTPKRCACGHEVSFIEGDACICKEGRLWLECPSCMSTMTISVPNPFAD